MSKVIDIEKANKYSKGKVANYLSQTMVDGEGFRVALYVSGCLFNCKGCYNKSIQNFSSGEDFGEDIVENILRDLSPSYIQGLSILGGEPFMNIETIYPVIKKFRETYGKSKDLWLWSGYTYEELLIENKRLKGSKIGKKLDYILNELDILIDGKFKQELFSRDLSFRGSSNQRIIDMSKTNGEEIVLWEGY